jgi:UDPglucose 6-dehydrogenase
MKIGIIGLGIVGEACKFGFEKQGHTVVVHDKKLETSLVPLLDCPIIYICVPTPSKEDGSCDTSIVESVLDDLLSLSGFNGCVVVKSTVPPGTCEKWRKVYDYGAFSEICFCPEFLRERSAVTDFVELNNVLVIGAERKKSQNLIKECHGDLPKKTLCCSPTQAELIKYYNNCFGALRVSFANEFFELCKSLGQDYVPVKRGLLQANNIPDQYFDVNDNVRGWSSICWNKDLPGILSLAKEQGVDMPMIQATVDSNAKYKKTPFKDTRESYE